MRAPAFAAYRSRLRQALDINWSPALAAVVAVCVLVVPGVAIGATTAQPGERLWHVKRGLERTRLALAWGADAEVEVHMDIAARRLGELNTVLSTGGAGERVVQSVIAELRDHTRAATERLGDVGRADRAALVQRVDRLADRQVAVLDVLIGVDCADSTDQQCVALAGAEEASVALQRVTTAIALAEDVPTDEVAGASVGATDMAVSSLGAAASEDATAAATPAESSESPTGTSGGGAGATPSEAPTASESPSAKDGSGSAATTASPAPPNPSTGQPSASDDAAESSSPATGPNTQETTDRPVTTTVPPSVDLPVQPKAKGTTPP